MNTSKFELKKSLVNNQFYFHLRAGNGEITLRSELYPAKQSCENAIASVKHNASLDSQYERKYNNGSYTFNLKGGNGRIIGSSENYSSSSARDNGIESVKKNAPTAPV